LQTDGCNLDERSWRAEGAKRLTFLQLGFFLRSEQSLSEEETSGFAEKTSPADTSLEQSNAKENNLKMLFRKSTTKWFQSA
jgi:hypothetical protein